MFKKYLYLFYVSIILNIVPLYAMEQDENSLGSDLQFVFDETYDKYINMTLEIWLATPITSKIFFEISDLFIKTSLEEIEQANLWFDGYPEEKIKKFYEESNLNSITQLPYMVKWVVPSNTNTNICGDTHGYMPTINEIFRNMKTGSEKHTAVIDEKMFLLDNNIFIALGDYMDRGGNSLKTIASFMLFKIKNREKVSLIRGNHENLMLNLSTSNLKTELLEIEPDYDTVEKIFTTLSKIYETLPAAIILGYKENGNIRYQFLTHGCPEIRIDYSDFLNYDLQNLRQSGGKRYCELKTLTLESLTKILSQIEPDFPDFVTALLKHLTCPDPAIGFYWTDVNLGTDCLPITLGCRGPMMIELTMPFIKSLLELIGHPENKIVGLIRAHDHNLPKYILYSKTSNGFSLENPSSAACLKIVDKRQAFLLLPFEKKCFPDEFTILTLIGGTVISSPQSTIYPPTYLRLSWENDCFNFMPIYNAPDNFVA